MKIQKDYSLEQLTAESVNVVKIPRCPIRPLKEAE